MPRREIQYNVMDALNEITFVRGCRQHNIENAIKFIAFYIRKHIKTKRNEANCIAGTFKMWSMCIWG